MLGAFASDSNTEKTFKKLLTDAQLAEAETATAIALHRLKGVGPKHALAVAQSFGSLWGLIGACSRQSRAAAEAQIAGVVKSDGKAVGKCTAEKLWSFCMSEDGNAMYAEDK